MDARITIHNFVDLVPYRVSQDLWESSSATSLPKKDEVISGNCRFDRKTDDLPVVQVGKRLQSGLRLLPHKQNEL